jgi:nicotinate dehydrogenase subunit A
MAMAQDSLVIQVNGQPHRVLGAPDTPLLYVLRNELQLKGPKFGCGLEQCGACMVHIDGRAVPSCQLPVSAVGSASVTTIEGLGGGPGQLHPVQQAFIQEQAAQCGYCTNGLVMAAASLLASNPAPSESEIRAGLSRNLCRCGSHVAVLRAVRSVAEVSA